MKITLRVALILLVSTSIIGCTGSINEYREFQVTNWVSQKEVTDVDGFNLVWQEYHGDTNWEIVYFDGASPTRITNNNLYDREPRVEDNEIAWYAEIPGTGTEFYLYDGTIHQLSNGEYSGAWSGELKDGLAVWRGWNGDYEILVYNGMDLIQITDNDSADEWPDTSDGLVVWEAVDGIYLYDHASTQTRQISSTGYYPDTSQGQVVWENEDIYLYDGNQIQQLTFSGDNSDPQIDHGKIVWRNNDHDKIFYWDGTSIQTIFEGPSVSWPLIENNIITWRSGNQAYLYQNGETTSFETNSYPVIGAGSIAYHRQDGETTPFGTASNQIYLATRNYEAYTSTLSPGWNLVSYPVDPLETPIKDVLSELDYYVIYEYVNGGYVTPSTIQPGKGYWLLSLTETTYTVHGLPWITPEIEVTTGWNMIGVKQLTENIEAKITGYNQIKTWTGVEYNTPDTLNQGIGYWLWVNEPQTINFQ